MRLELFDFIEDVTNLLELNLPTYQYIEHTLVTLFKNFLADKNDVVVGVTSRIKGKDSLKEKLIRNKYYLNYQTAESAIEALPDLIGLTVECRFISDENDLFKDLSSRFVEVENGYFQCVGSPDVYLNLKMPQPQLQRNGFTIYRIDGYVNFNDRHINFELQIKSLIHTFWSEVEHQVVYKNKQFVVYDAFMKNILGSIRDNLEVVDRQLQLVYKQIANQSNQENEIGMNESGFKVYIAKSINDLVALKMANTVGFTTDFKKCSSILSQYVYIKDFVSSEHPQFKMIDYFEHFNYLQMSDLDFSSPIALECTFKHEDPFCNIIGQYWEEIINIDFEWHVFFVMLFAIEPGNNIQDFTQFVEVIRNLLIAPSWYREQFVTFGDVNGQKARDALTITLAKILVSIGKVDIVHEDKLLRVMEIFKDYVENLMQRVQNYEEFCKSEAEIKKHLEFKIVNLF